MQPALERAPGRESQFWEAWRRTTQVYVALLKREAASRRRTPLITVLSVLEPLTIILFFSFAIWLLERRPIYGTSTILFLSTGLFPAYLFAHCGRRMRIDSPRGRFPAEKMLDHVIVYVTWGVIDYAIMGLVLFTALFFLASHQAFPTNVIPIVQSCTSIILLGFGVAMVNLAIRRVFPVWPYIFPAIARCLILGSGVHFIPDYLPPATRTILSYNPLQHAIQLFRMGFYPDYPHLTLDRTYLAWCCLIAVTAGLVIERFSRRREAQ
jgi:capsular polysaccharide transport system permease protein